MLRKGRISRCFFLRDDVRGKIWFFFRYSLMKLHAFKFELKHFEFSKITNCDVRDFTFYHNELTTNSEKIKGAENAPLRCCI